MRTDTPIGPVDSRWLDDYERIATAIEFIRMNRLRQPSLAEIAQEVHLSEFHLQRLFSRWAGISPKRFLQSLTVEHAKGLLAQSADILSASHESGLSGPGRLHDLFVTIEAMTPGEFKSKGRGIDIRYGVHPTPFGECLIGQTKHGICFLEFMAGESRETKLMRLGRSWPEAEFIEDPDSTVKTIARIFSRRSPTQPSLNLLVRGTNFQIKVWNALLRIPPGSVSHYTAVANWIGHPRASRAVGSAIAANPIAWLIPCHRVLRADGQLGGYHWGTSRKMACLLWESGGV